MYISGYTQPNRRIWVYTTNTMGIYETTTLNRRIRFTQPCTQKDLNIHNQSEGYGHTTKLKDLDIHKPNRMTDINNQTDGYGNNLTEGNGYTI